MTRAVALSALLSICATGCPPPDASQAALTATARALVAADEVVAPAYAAQAQTALDGAASLEAYRAEMLPWDALEAALRGTRAALLTAQAGLDAWRSTSEASSFLSVLPGLVGAVGELVRQLPDLGVDVPDELSTAFELLQGIGGQDE